MSINHYSSDLSPSQWWSHDYMMKLNNMDSSSAHQKSSFICQLSPNPMLHNRNGAVGSIDLNNDDEDDDRPAADDGGGAEEAENMIPKERLFEKPLTPSDVGKLNRLVIPKQHAEKHFPMNGGGGGGEAGENGLLLGFEDETGKSWRFRYSYWNSSQSYVLTKGWSRFVKEKRLDAGDIVVFLRHKLDTGRLFIGWRRRNSGGQEGGVAHPPSRVFYSGQAYPSQYQAGPYSVPYQNESLLHAGSSLVQQNQTSTTTGSSGNSKRLRLFGVNLECQPDESEPSTPVGSPMSSQGQAGHHHHHHPYYHQYYSPNHMDISFSSGADVYRQG